MVTSVIYTNAMLNARGKYWCFTLNNYTSEEVSLLSSLVSDGENQDRGVAYLGYGREVGGGGTPHLQGYLELDTRRRLTYLRDLPGLGRAHFELRKGTATQAIDYCKKDSTPENPYQEFGCLAVSNQGRRTDLEEVKELLDQGGSLLDVAESHFGDFCRYHRGFERYQSLRAPRTVRRVQVYCLWGAAGTGKTRFVFEREDKLWISSDPSLKWFDGYAGEPAALLDDFRGECPPSLLLRVLDIYPTRVAVKGGFVPWIPERIYVTSNAAPPFGYTDMGGSHSVADAIMRRFTKVVEFVTSLDFEDRDKIDHLLD